MRKFESYLRIILILSLAYTGAEFVVKDPNYKLALFNPYVIGFLFFILIILVSFEVIIGVLQNISDQLMTEERRLAYEEKKRLRKEHRWSRKFMRYLTGKQDLPEAHLVIEDHNYDGIRELNNPLPPWWLYLFYITIIFGVVYVAYYDVFGGPDQEENYQNEVALAEAEIEEYKKVAVDFVDAATVTQLTDEASLTSGAQLFSTHCAVCHLSDGGGSIGPNLTDAYWILGGDIKGVFQTISSGGRPGKGMIAWNTSLRPSEIQQLSSFVLTLQGTTPENPKAPEGDLISN